MRIAHPDIEFRDDLPEGPLVVAFDRRLVSQALTNIVKNATEAIAAVPEDERGAGKIQITLEETPPGIVAIEVIDNGKGFPVEGRQRLLEPYMTTRDGGTGLGLPIVAKILEEHGGGMELLDNPTGRGGRVRMWIRRMNPAGSREANDGRTAPPELRRAHA
jgi:two-component system nitrogen regulation sensor histidine kinase NtrY